MKTPRAETISCQTNVCSCQLLRGSLLCTQAELPGASAAPRRGCSSGKLRSKHALDALHAPTPFRNERRLRQACQLSFCICCTCAVVLYVRFWLYVVYIEKRCCNFFFAFLSQIDVFF